MSQRFLKIIFLLFFSTRLIAQTDLHHINSWAIQLQNINISEIENNNTIELVVIDYSSTGGPEGIFSSSQISQIKNSGKTVLAYLSIGEAETYRWYWQNTWDANYDGIPDVAAPSWLGQSNPDWLDNYKVRYWEPDWQNIIYSYLDVIISQGFDGIYCDIVDAYYYWEFEVGEKLAAASAMIQFVSNIRSYVNSRAGSSFFFVTQNAESITDEYDVSNSEKISYFNSIQGQGCEGLFFRGSQANNNNYNPDNYRLNLLKQFKAHGIRVFSIEYLTQQDKIDQYKLTVQPYNFVPYVSTRPLDTLFDGINLYSGGQLSIAGKISYYSSGSPVKNTTLYLTGQHLEDVDSDFNGDFQISNLYAGENYIVTPTKSNNLSANTITSYDAALTAQIAMGFRSASNNERIATDVDKNGAVLMYDASLIAQFAVGLTSGSNHSGEWTFNPQNKTLSQLTEDVVDVNFQAILLGDVDGNWSPGGLLTKGDPPENNYFHLHDLHCAQNEKISIPINAEANEIIYSCDLKLRFDPSILKFDKLLLTTSSESFFHVVNDQSPGILRLGLFGTEAITQPGKYLEILFDIIGSEGEVSNIELLSYRVNSEDAKQAVSTIIVERPKKGLPKDYELFQNYPNPFNSTTKIQFSLAHSQNVQLQIFTINGQLIETLIDGKRAAGVHEMDWIVNDFPSSIYFCQLKVADFVETIKLILQK